MAELPEITKLAGQMRDTLRGKGVASVRLLQEKCANLSPEEINRRICGAKIADVYHRGKWIVTALDNGEHILLSLGMGADVLYYEQEKGLPDKYQVQLLFTDGSGYTIRFWWFGKYLLVAADALATEPNTGGIGLDPFDDRFTPAYFSALLKGRKTQVKSFLMNQKNIGGIGNMYMHDILFKARLHPQKQLSELDDAAIDRLYQSIVDVLGRSREKGSFAYESDFFGQKGGFSVEDFLVGYRENGACPDCGAGIVSIKAGGSATFICPSCQKL